MEELRKNFRPGDIIVANDTCNEMMEQIRQASALVVEADNETCHAAIAGLSLDIPVIIRAENALGILKSGAYVTVDAEKGYISTNNK